MVKMLCLIVLLSQSHSIPSCGSIIQLQRLLDTMQLREICKKKKVGARERGRRVSV